MTFRPFRRRPQADEPGEAHDLADTRRDWVESGLASEVEAFLAGRLVDHLAGRHLAVPAWAAMNRLAHADHHELMRLVGGAGLDVLTAPGYRVHSWAEQERFVAAHVAATDGVTADGLRRLQRDVLVPTELSLIAHPAGGAMTARQVMDVAREAVKSHRVPRDTRGDTPGR